jgi:hypothetical protein
MTLLVVLFAPVVVLCDSPSMDTACKYSVPLEISELVPEVLPEIWTAFCTGVAEIVTVLALFPMPIPAPAEIERLPLEPFTLDTKFVAA